MTAFQKTTIAIHALTIGTWIYLIREIDKTDKQFQNDLKQVNTAIKQSYEKIDHASRILNSHLQTIDTINTQLDDLNKSIYERNERIIK